MHGWHMMTTRHAALCCALLWRLSPAPFHDPPAGDRTHTLMWRLSNGELPQTKIPKLILIEIGMNDLGAIISANSSVAEADILQEAEPAAQR